MPWCLHFSSHTRAFFSRFLRLISYCDILYPASFFAADSSIFTCHFGINFITSALLMDHRYQLQWRGFLYFQFWFTKMRFPDYFIYTRHGSYNSGSITGTCFSPFTMPRCISSPFSAYPVSIPHQEARANCLSAWESFTQYFRFAFDKAPAHEVYFHIFRFLHAFSQGGILFYFLTHILEITMRDLLMQASTTLFRAGYYKLRFNIIITIISACPASF